MTLSNERKVFRSKLLLGASCLVGLPISVGLILYGVVVLVPSYGGENPGQVAAVVAVFVIIGLAHLGQIAWNLRRLRRLGSSSAAQDA